MPESQKKSEQGGPTPDDRLSDAEFEALSHDEKVSYMVSQWYDLSACQHPEPASRVGAILRNEWSTPYPRVGESLEDYAKRPIPAHPKNWQGWDDLKRRVARIEEFTKANKCDKDQKSEPAKNTDGLVENKPAASKTS